MITKNNLPLKKGEEKNQTPPNALMKVVETPKNGSSTNEIAKPEIKNPEKDLNKRISKIAELQKTVIKRQSLRDTFEKLQSFSLGSNRMEDFLTIEDSEGNEFKTSNSEVIKQVVDFIKEIIVNKTAEIDNQLLTANIN